MSMSLLRGSRREVARNSCVTPSGLQKQHTPLFSTVCHFSTEYKAGGRDQGTGKG
jgi:hypothetical protein